MRGVPQPGTPDFIPALVLPNIFNRSNFKFSAFSGLKVHSRRRKRKIVFRLEQTNITKRKAVDCVLKNHKYFSIKIGICRDISVQNRALFAHFRPVTFGHVTGCPQTRFAQTIYKHPLDVPILVLHAKCFLSYR